MVKIKEPSVAGSFYTADKTDLENQISNFAEHNKNLYDYSTRAVIVPHAGLIYSGRLAYEGINQLDKNIKNLFIFAPSHRVAFDGLAISSFDKWKTPLGEVSVNQGICFELIEKFGASYNDNAFAPEHSAEIQLPIIQTTLKDVKIIPVLLGKADFSTVTNIIKEYYPNKENGFLISSDLSHFLTDENANKLDHLTANMIETNSINGFRFDQACGALGIAGLMQFANENNYSLIRIDMTNSSAVTGDKSNVVGYGCWFLYEGDKNEFIKKNYSDFLINLVKTVLKSSFTKERITIDYPQVLDETGACFVTLEKFGQLRGCIGSIIAHQPLIVDLVNHSKDAAFNDHRFNPVNQNELDDLKVSVSILTDPKKMEFNGEEDLLNKMVPNIDGIIIKDGNYQAVYLPVVWEQIPDKREFLNSLKMKAGLSPTHFSKTFEAYRFETIYIKEE